MKSEYILTKATETRVAKLREIAGNNALVAFGEELGPIELVLEEAQEKNSYRLGIEFEYSGEKTFVLGAMRGLGIEFERAAPLEQIESSEYETDGAMEHDADGGPPDVAQ